MRGNLSGGCDRRRDPTGQGPALTAEASGERTWSRRFAASVAETPGPSKYMTRVPVSDAVPAVAGSVFGMLAPDGPDIVTPLEPYAKASPVHWATGGVLSSR